MFGDVEDRRDFLTLLGEATARVPARIHAYALMPNHFHLLVESEVDALADLMRRVTGRYAQRFNVKYGYDGPLFRGRYRSESIDDERYLATVLRYIHRNPLGEGPIRSDTFRWTSHPAYLGRGEPPEWLTVNPLLSRFRSRLEYDAFITDRDRDGSRRPLHRTRRPRPLAPENIEMALGIGSSRELDVVRRGGRGVRNDARLAALLLARDHTSAGLERLAERYGYRSVSGARAAISRGRRRAGRDPQFAELLDHARLRLGLSLPNDTPTAGEDTGA